MDEKDGMEKVSTDHFSEIPEETCDSNKPDGYSVLSDLKHVFGHKFIWRKMVDEKNILSNSSNASIGHGSTDSLHPPELQWFDDQTKPMESLESHAIIMHNSISDNPIVSPIRSSRIVLIISIILILLVGLVYLLSYLAGPKSPGVDVVGSFNGKNITIEDLNGFIALEQAKEYEHAICKIHGRDHSQCTATEECETHPIDTLEAYREMITRLAVEQIVQDWASAQGITQREDVRHEMNDLVNDASVNQFIEKLHEDQIAPESITSWEVQQYYNENMETFKGKFFAEVEDNIRQILANKRDREFFPQYMEDLKKAAGLQVNFDLLKVTEPTDEEVNVYYSENRSEFQIAASMKATELRIISGDVKNKANEVLRKVRSGQSFESVAMSIGHYGKTNDLLFENGSSEATLETAIMKLQPGEISDPVENADGSVSIVKLVSTVEASTLPLVQVESIIRSSLLRKNMENEYELRKDEALFSIHSKRYTLGDFFTEFKELSPNYQDALSAFEQKQQLVEQLITKELLLEENEDGSADERVQHSYEELRVQYLTQVLHQEKVDSKLVEPTEEEIKHFYDTNKKTLKVPASVQISLIWIDQGLDGEKSEQARQKADEAQALLNSGTDFAEVAKKFSEDSTAQSGGVVEEVLYQDHLPYELKSAVFALQATETSGIIDYQNGYYIIRMREKMNERQQTYEEAYENIKSHLDEQNHIRLESKLEETILKDANFVIYDTILRKLVKKNSGT